MDNAERIDRLLKTAGKLAERDGADPASDAVRWNEIGVLAAQGLQATGVSVFDESRIEPDEELVPLKYGWTSTPGEVEAWCERFGLPWEYFKGKIVVRFGENPGSEVRGALKASGFRGKKAGRKVTWTHGLHGMWLDSKSGKSRAYRDAIDAGEGEEQAQEAAGRCRKPLPVDDRSEDELLKAVGGWR